MALFLIYTGYPTVLRAQVNISGKAGLLYIPSAEVVEEGTFSGGYAHNPVNYAIKFNKRNINFVNLVVLPRLEVNINLLRPNGYIPFKEGGLMIGR